MSDPKVKKIAKSRRGCWVHCAEPSEADLQQLINEFGLEEDLLRDALDIYEAPRVEQEGSATYVFIRYSYPEGIDIATEPLLLIYLPSYLITIQRKNVSFMNPLIEGKRQVVTTQHTKTFLQIMLETMFRYQRDVQKSSKQILSYRSRLNKSDIDNKVFISFVDIEENLNEFLAALEPRKAVLRSLESGKYLPLYEEDKDLLEDLRLGTEELVEIIRSQLKTISNTREAYSTIMANNLNKTFRRLTSISIFLTIPAITAALYGMNLALPLAGRPNAFWLVLAIVLTLTGATVWLFRRLRWL